MQAGRVDSLGGLRPRKLGSLDDSEQPERKNTMSPYSEPSSTKAYRLGQEAYRRGVECSPVLDPELMTLIKGPVGSNTGILKAWQKGWIQANLEGAYEF